MHNHQEPITVTLQHYRVTREVTELREMVVFADSEEEALDLAWSADPAFWSPVRLSDHWEPPTVAPHTP